LFKLLKVADIHFDNDDDQEFDRYEWVSFWYPLKKIIFFKKDVYKKVLRFFSNHYSELNVN
jgi:putative (di)nucleoside polyphosphate hydrolase